MATSAVRDTVTRCTPGTVVGGMNAVVRLPGNRVAERQHIRLSSWRQGVKQQAAAHPTMVTSESMAICESGQGGGGQAVRRGVAKGGASRVRGEQEGRRGGSHGEAAHLRTKKISFPLAGRKSEIV